MELLKEMLDNYMIIKEADRELYYDTKDGLKAVKPFLEDKLGYDVIVHPDFIKLEKFPGRVEGWMGIEAFEEILDYCLFILLIMYLEDKVKEEQFILSQILEYISLNFQGEEIDWTVYGNRKSLVRVLRFALELMLIKVNDGSEEDFAGDESAEVLYENTGLSKYVIRSFSMDIYNANSYRDFINMSWEDINTERGSLRKNRVYRTLLMSPALYNEGSDDQDYYYVKNFKGIIENDFEKYLGWKVHVHRDAAMVVLDEEDRCREYFPYNSAISDIVLMLNKMLVDRIKAGELHLDSNSNMILDRDDFLDILRNLKEEKSAGWSKEYRECRDDYLFDSVVNYMKGYCMLYETGEMFYIKPLTGKIIGEYPKEFLERGDAGEQQMENK